MNSLRCFPNHIIIGEVSVKMNEFTNLVDKYSFLGKALGPSRSSARNGQVNPRVDSRLTEHTAVALGVNKQP